MRINIEQGAFKMIIDFNDIQEVTIPCMNNGEGMMTVRMYNDESYRIIPTTIHPGGKIGLHTQSSGDDLNYILSGNGMAVKDRTGNDVMIL